MPMYDRRCTGCEKTIIDCYEPITPPERECECGAPTVRVMLPGNANSVIGDECEIWIRHGLCWEDGSPRRFTSKSEIARVAKEQGKTNIVEHQGAKGSDKSKHTTRWF